jgi:flavorubredoxin
VHGNQKRVERLVGVRCLCETAVAKGALMKTYKVAPDIEVLAADFPIPGFGQLAINAFVLKGSEPLLVDTGAVVHKEDFLASLKSVIDPSDLKWLWLTHTDFDHIGGLQQLLEEFPQIRVITTFLGVGIMSLAAPLPMDRLYLLNPGERLRVGDRTLSAIRPPAFDNPCTTGFYDDKSGAFFSSDCFGALLPAIPQSAADLSEKDLRDGQVFWSTIDAPWLHKVDKDHFAKELNDIRKMAPKVILSSHLPAAPGNLIDRLLSALATVPTASPFVGPNQAALEQMLKQLSKQQPQS